MLTPVPNATPRYDENGEEVVDIVTCGTCGRSWNDAQVSEWTPAPSGRCPFEYEHEDPDEWHDRMRDERKIMHYTASINHSPAPGGWLWPLEK